MKHVRLVFRTFGKIPLHFLKEPIYRGVQATGVGSGIKSIRKSTLEREGNQAYIQLVNGTLLLPVLSSSVRQLHAQMHYLDANITLSSTRIGLTSYLPSVLAIEVAIVGVVIIVAVGSLLLKFFCRKLSFVCHSILALDYAYKHDPLPLAMLMVPLKYEV
ncbi:hypothetical protein Tco_1374282 [Tanacetum coccineum]